MNPYAGPDERPISYDDFLIKVGYWVKSSIGEELCKSVESYAWKLGERVAKLGQESSTRARLFLSHGLIQEQRIDPLTTKSAWETGDKICYFLKDGKTPQPDP